MALRAVHEAFAWLLLGTNLVAGGWALVAHRRPAARVPALWWATTVAQVLVFVQLSIGGALIAVAGRTVEQMHVLYGFSAGVAVAVLYGYRAQVGDRRYLLYGLGGLFIAGLAVREMFLTGAGA